MPAKSPTLYFRKALSFLTTSFRKHLVVVVVRFLFGTGNLDLQALKKRSHTPVRANSTLLLLTAPKYCWNPTNVVELFLVYLVDGNGLFILILCLVSSCFVGRAARVKGASYKLGAQAFVIPQYTARSTCHPSITCVSPVYHRPAHLPGHRFPLGRDHQHALPLRPRHDIPS